jgi:hypothetical protein
MGLHKPTIALLFLFIYEYPFSSLVHFSPFEYLILGDVNLIPDHFYKHPLFRD